MTASDMHVLLLIARDKSMQSPVAHKRDRPFWDEIETALENAFEHGGYAILESLRPEDAYVNELRMVSLPGKFRIIILTRDNDPKRGLLEWWEPTITGFRGTIRFGDDEIVGKRLLGVPEIVYRFKRQEYWPPTRSIQL